MVLLFNRTFPLSPLQLFCPEFTVAPAGGAAGKKGSSSSGVGGGGASSVRDEAEDLQTLDSCEYIWAPGVGFARLVTKALIFAKA